MRGSSQAALPAETRQEFLFCFSWLQCRLQPCQDPGGSRTQRPEGRMKITDVELLAIPDHGQSMLVVAVDTDEGIFGLGEVGVRHSPQVTLAVVQEMRDRLNAADPTRIEHLWQTLFRGGFFSADRMTAAVLSAIGVALWEIRGKAHDGPLLGLICGGATELHT